MINEDMKKLIIAIVMTMGMALPSQAQSDQDALISAIDTIVRKYSLEHHQVVADIVEEAYERVRKNAETVERIAECYYSRHTKDSAMCFTYINRSLAVDSTYAPTYVLAAKAMKGERYKDQALQWYERGIRNCPEGIQIYEAYANTLAADKDYDGALAILDRLQKNNPAANVNLMRARLYNNQNDESGGDVDSGIAQQMLEAFAGTSIADMEENDAYNYIYTLYKLNRYDECAEKAGEALGKFPKNNSIQKFNFRSIMQLKDFNGAITAFDKWIVIDGAELEVFDYRQYALALYNVKRFEDARAAFEKVITLDDAEQKDKDWADGNIVACYGQMASAFVNNKEYDKAISFFETFMKQRKEAGTMTGLILNTFGNLWLTKGQAVTDENEKESAYLEADKMFKQVVDNFSSEYKNYANALGYMGLLRYIKDPDGQKALGKDVFEKYVEVVNANNLLDETGFKFRMCQAYNYLALVACTHDHKYQIAKDYCYKVLEMEGTGLNRQKAQAQSLLEDVLEKK